MRKIISMITAFILLVGITAGCSSNSASSSESGKKELVWWALDNPAFVKTNKKLIADYEKTHKDVTIKLQTFPYDAFIQKLKASFASKNSPDIVQIFGTWATEYAENGLLAPVSSEDQKLIKDKFYDATYGAYVVKDKIYGIPHEYNLENGGILAHPEMFQKAGVPYPPKTWDELVNASKKLTIRDGKNIKQKGFDFISYDNITFTFLSLILQQNGKYWTADNHVDFTSPEAVTAMTELKKFVTDYKVTDTKSFGGKLDIIDYFYKNQDAMVIRGPWTIAIGKENYKTDKFDYIPMPSFTSNPPSFAAESGWGEVVSNNSKNKKEAWDFVKFMTTDKENAHYFNVQTYTVPANKEVAEDPSFLKDAPKMKASLDVLPYGEWIGPLQERDFVFKQVNDQFQLIANGKLSVEDGLNKIQTSVNQMIDRHKK